MALLRCWRCCCSSGLRLGFPRAPLPSAAAAASLLHRALRPPEPCPWLRSPVYQYSAKANSKSLLSTLVSKVKYMNTKYEKYLERTFPRFYQLYSTFIKGFQVLFSEVKEIRRIKRNMIHKNIRFHQLPYREMEKLRQFRRDVMKVIPVGILALPPFANYLVLLLMYLFPRQLLIRHFWTAKQQAEFLDTYHSMRKEAYADVVNGLMNLSHSLTDSQLRKQMLDLCKKFQEGFHPSVTELKAVRTLFVDHPFGIQQLRIQQVKALSRVLFLTPRLPPFFLRYRLQSHLSELYHLDQAMLQLGVKELTDDEVEVACYTRGLNSVHLGTLACRLWLNQWLALSCSLKESEASLLAHGMVLLSTNFRPSAKG
ncbi:LETM1 domain-containing protein 1 [Elgaria multicarinata webbii]|uniref:LETM1 domain-containing protein 1 n=1 Tax=Elgaria multicarinata webbii TaxID=159646 RepID=UPI002FCD39D4